MRRMPLPFVGYAALRARAHGMPWCVYADAVQDGFLPHAFPCHRFLACRTVLQSTRLPMLAFYTYPHHTVLPARPPPPPPRRYHKRLALHPTQDSNTG